MRDEFLRALGVVRCRRENFRSGDVRDLAGDPIQLGVRE
jgi:hypothetical protein